MKSLVIFQVVVIFMVTLAITIHAVLHNFIVCVKIVVIF